MPARQEQSHVINRVISSEASPSSTFRLATGNEGKRQQWERALGIPVEKVPVAIFEVQDDDPRVVLHEKAKQAYVVNDAGPIWVEDTSFFVAGLGENRPGVYADQFTGTREQREALVQSVKGKGRKAEFRVGMAIYDGEEVHEYWGSVKGKIAKKLREGEEESFGFNDIFIPDGQVDQNGNPLSKKKRKTLSQMTPDERLPFSPRSQIARQVQEHPVVIDKKVYALPNPYEIQEEAALEKRAERLSNERAVKFAYQLECLEGSEILPQQDFSVENERPPVYKHILAGGNIERFVTPEDSPSLGVVVTAMDKAVDMKGRSERLQIDKNGDVILLQMGNKEMQRALRARAQEFLAHHNEEIYAYLRGVTSGEITIAHRSPIQSEVIEELLQIKRDENQKPHEFRAMRTAAFSELGYNRQSSDAYVSRKEAANKGLFVNTLGMPTSVFWHNAMPPVSGHIDVATMDALSYRPTFIPRNNIFSEGLDWQLRFLHKAQENVASLDLPEDIEDLCQSMFGMAVGSEDPKNIAQDVKRFADEGGTFVRIYTTNLNPRTIETAEEIRQVNGNRVKILVAPIGDKRQADQLIGPNIKLDAVFVGHGGGENCTSLEGGGTANAMELLYSMYLDPAYEHVAMGVEGGTGSAYGPILPLVDVISLGQRGIGAGVETGGLWVKHQNGDAVIPYHGSASPVTQHIEAAVREDLFKRRLDDAGQLYNVEGKPGYMRKPRSVHSVAQVMRRQRELAGRALADQGVMSMSDLREKVAKEGHNHRIVTPQAATVAGAHRSYS